jgi:hypothetical protein
MSEQDFELIAITNGWLRLKRGWYHPFALAYIGWNLEPLCFKSAKAAIRYQRETALLV